MLKLKVRELAKERNMSMSKLSRLADVNTTTMLRIWHDPTMGFTSSTLEKFVRAFNVPITDIVEYIPDTKDGKGKNF